MLNLYSFEDICEDPEIKERILELKTEQEIKRQAEAKRKVRRSQSNTRTQSVRRTSLRDKGLTARRDAVEEARFRLQAENPVSYCFINILHKIRKSYLVIYIILWCSIRQCDDIKTASF